MVSGGALAEGPLRPRCWRRRATSSGSASSSDIVDDDDDGDDDDDVDVDDVDVRRTLVGTVWWYLDSPSPPLLTGSAQWGPWRVLWFGCMEWYRTYNNTPLMVLFLYDHLALHCSGDWFRRRNETL